METLELRCDPCSSSRVDSNVSALFLQDWKRSAKLILSDVVRKIYIFFLACWSIEQA